MDTNKNLYTVIYATIMVVVVAVVLALASYLLKERQQRNIEIEKKQMILKSAHLAADVDKAKDMATYIEDEYDKYITDTTVNSSGQTLPLFICRVGSESYYIVPLHGTGLWGAIWGYLTLRGDLNTVYGTVFDHKGETPGLGAEITTNGFADQFIDKKLFDGDDFKSIQVVKGGNSQGNPHQVDAISGGTITSKGVEAMLKNCISQYLEYFKTLRVNNIPASDTLFAPVTDTLSQVTLPIK